MIEVGALVRDWLSGDLGIVTGYQIEPIFGTEQVLVKFLTGYWEGQTDPCSPMSLEEVK
jgi:hypothetical protein